MDIGYNFLEEISRRIGDAWYILDLEKFDRNYDDLLNAFKNIYPQTQIAYSYKTNYIPVLCRKTNEKGGYAEVVSEMEYDLAIKVGVQPSKIIVNGPYKPKDALEKFLINGSLVNLDSNYEAEILKSISKRCPDKQFNVGLRCNFDTNTIEFSRFGFDVLDRSFDGLIKDLRQYKNIKLSGLSYHFPNRDLISHKERVEKMIIITKKIFSKEPLSFIDVGGGLGGRINNYIKQQLNYDVADYFDYANAIASKFNQEFSSNNKPPLLILEPGTAIVADTMKFICKVAEIKKIRNKYIAITSGSKVNFHPLSSKINLPIEVYGDDYNLNRYFYDSIEISGYTCMENDYLFRGYKGKLGIGDFLVFDNVGSYSIVFKPPFIQPNVPIVSLKNGEIEVIKEKETFEYIFQTYKKGF